MHPTRWEAATPFLANLGLIVATGTLTAWLQTHVENLYTKKYEALKVTPTRLGHPKELSNLALWAVDLGTIFGTAAVTAGSAAGLLQIDRDPSLLVYAGIVLTLFGFGLCLRLLSPIGYDKKAFLCVSYVIWIAFLLNLGLLVYSLLHYHN